MSSSDRAPMPFIDLDAQRRRLGDDLNKAILAAVEEGSYILGPQVKALESQLSDYSGAAHTVTCASGTDALVLALRALGIGPGDAVVVPTFTFAASAEAVALVGATPVFCDVLEDTFNIDASSAREAVAVAEQAGLRPRAVMPVDLFGQPADYDAIGDLAESLGLDVIADAAQSFGATWNGRRVGTLARVTTTSFFPAKPLGCYGDGGAVFTDEGELADRLRSLCVHGKGTHKYENVRIGMNSRLDTIQAAVLLQKLTIFDDELSRRDEAASRYAKALDGIVGVPALTAGATSAWAQYTVRLPAGRRDDVVAALAAAGVPTAVYYPVPLHRQAAYRGYSATPRLDVSNHLAEISLSVPMHSYLNADHQDRVASELVEAVGRA